MAEKEKRLTLQNVLKQVVAKLIRRHPHIFGEKHLMTSQEVLQQWDEIKQSEKKKYRKSALDGIPKNLPALARAQKIAKKIKGTQFTLRKEKVF